MDSKSVAKVLSSIKSTDRVLDIGGWAQPLRRANAVIDCFPYETRGMYGHIGDGEEQFKKSDWIQWDICDRKPWPFKDKEFDFVVCSHVLEDIRDPLWVCAEINRIAKRGYIETPSRAAESTYGVESYRFTGSHHHRWFVEFIDGRLRFTHKDPYVLEKKRGIYLIHTPAVVSLFWEGEFKYEEGVLHQTKKALEEELDRWTRDYRSGMPAGLRTFETISPYMPKYMKKNIQKLCRYVWKLPKI